MKQHAIIICLTSLLLASCGKQDVHTACYKNGDHENMSDGRIIRICDCIEKAISKDKLSEQESGWIVAWFNKKAIETATPHESAKSKGIVASITQLKARCDAIK
ncbi:MAG: hypothetical protein WAO98_00345 [Alphaproteobacteria bacterium]